MVGRFKAILFDKDGTLVDFHATWDPVIERLVGWLAETTTGSAGGIAAALGFDETVGRLDPTSPVLTETTAEMAARLGPVCGATDIDRFAAELDATMQPWLAECVVGIDGVDGTLRVLQRHNVRLAIVTNDAEVSARAQLEALGWLERFDAVLGYDSGFGGKPHPGIVTEAVRRLGCEPSEAALAGDTATDVAAAKNAGVFSVIVGAAGSANGADLSIEALPELLSVLEAERDVGMTQFVQRGYDRIADAYLLARRGATHDLPQLDRLIAELDQGDRVLDLGCGAGLPITARLVAAGLEVTGIDISERQIHLAKRYVPQAEFLVRSMTDLQADEFEVEAVVAFYSLFHTPRESFAQLLRTLRTFLPTGGRLMCTFGSTEWEGEEPFFGAPMRWSHHDAATSVRLVVAAGFNIERAEFVEHEFEDELERHLVVSAVAI